MRDDNDAGYDGVLDVPDDPNPTYTVCVKCQFELEETDDADCGEPGCPVETNSRALYEMGHV